MKQPTLSVMMANYNHAQFLPMSVRSIVDQSFRFMEFIIIDDASDDGSLEILQRFAREHSNIRLFRNARNVGGLQCAAICMDLARGDYLYFAGADDQILPGFLEKSMSMLASYPQAGMCLSISAVIGKNGYEPRFPSPMISSEPCFLPPEKAYRAINGSYGVWHHGSSVIIRTDALVETGGFDPKLGFYADAFTYQLVAAKHGACFVPEILTAFRISEDSYTVRMMNDVGRYREVTNHAKELMCSRYSDVFSAKYVNEWERSRLFEIALKSLSTVRDSQVTFLNNLRGLQPPRRLADRFFHWFLRVLMSGQYWTIKLGVSMWIPGGLFPRKILGSIRARFGKGQSPNGCASQDHHGGSSGLVSRCQSDKESTSGAAHSVRL
jgi:glycosyltransferase involved in cell wall biosynthesis